jgi:hypothetical protein
MTSPTSEPYEEEMLQRARILCETRGTLEMMDEKGRSIPFMVFRTDRLRLAIDTRTNEIQIGLRNEVGVGLWAIYHVDTSLGQYSVFKPERYQECVELMRPLMVLDDLADI